MNALPFGLISQPCYQVEKLTSVGKMKHISGRCHSCYELCDCSCRQLTGNIDRRVWVLALYGGIRQLVMVSTDLSCFHFMFSIFGEVFGDVVPSAMSAYFQRTNDFITREMVDPLEEVENLTGPIIHRSF